MNMPIKGMSLWLEELKEELRVAKTEVDNHRKANEVLSTRKIAIQKAEAEMEEEGKSVEYLRVHFLASIENLINKSGVEYRASLEKRDTLEALIESIENN